MSFWTLVLLTVVSFTFPSMHADSTNCNSGVLPLTDLATVEVHFQQRYAPRDTVLGVVDGRGKEGQRGSYTFTTNQTGTLWLISTDLLGNRSCQSNPLGVNIPLDVPVLRADGRTLGWYDITGRRYKEKPLISGVYFQRLGVETKKVVIIK